MGRAGSDAAREGVREAAGEEGRRGRGRHGSRRRGRGNGDGRELNRSKQRRFFLRYVMYLCRLCGVQHAHVCLSKYRCR